MPQGKSNSGWRLTPKRIAMGDLTRDLYVKRISAETKKAELEAVLAEVNADLAEIEAVKETVALFQQNAVPGTDYTKDIRDALASINSEAVQPRVEIASRPVGRPSGSRGLPAVSPTW